VKFKSTQVVDAVYGHTSLEWTCLLACADAIGKRWKAITVAGVISFAVAAVGLYSDALSLSDKMCSSRSMFSTCRTLNLGTVPTKKEESDWAVVSKGSDCSALERIYGENGFYSAQAKRRLDLPKYAPASKEMTYPRSIPITNPRPNRKAALDQLKLDGLEDAKRLCSNAARLYAGQIGVGNFVPDVSPRCEAVGGDVACEVSGHVVCTVLVPDRLKTCPALGKEQAK
jgi:hypothetical protein